MHLPSHWHTVAFQKYYWCICLLISSSSLTLRQTIAISMRVWGGGRASRWCKAYHAALWDARFLFKCVLCLQAQKMLYLYPNWEKCSKTRSYLLPSNSSCSEAAHLCLFAIKRHCTLSGQPRLEAVCCDSLGKSLHQIKNSLFVFGEGSPSLFQCNLLGSITLWSHLHFR